MNAKLSAVQRRAAKAGRALRRGSRPDFEHRFASEVLGFFRVDRVDDAIALCPVLLRKLLQIQRFRKLREAQQQARSGGGR